MELKTIDDKSAILLSQLSIETFLQAYQGVHPQHDLNAYCKNNYSPEATQQLLTQNDTEAVIAYDEESPAGFYVIKHHQCPVKLDGECSELKQIYVLAEWFGKGLGKYLFESIVQRALEHKSQWLWLCVSDLNHRAQAFYQKLGFSRVGTGPILQVGKDRLPSSILALKINS